LPRLHVLQGPDRGRSFRTSDGAVVLGRVSHQFQLSDQGASRRHAEIRSDNGVWVLVDLNSSNGTYLNGQRIVRPNILKHGDHIKIGTTLLVFSGQDQVEGFSGPEMIRDQVDLDIDGRADSSILSSAAVCGESLILPAPDTADAVTAWNIVHRITEAIGAMESVEALLERISDTIINYLIVDHFVLLLTPPGSARPVPQVVRYRNRDQVERPKIVTSQTLINHVLETRQGVLCSNAMTDSRFGVGGNEDSVHRLGLRSVICVPIVVREQVFGIFHLDCSASHHTYTSEQFRLAVAIGRLTGMALQNARLMETRMRTERLAATGEAVAYLSHHIRNILQGMQGGADVVEIGFNRGELKQAQAGWPMVKRNVERIYDLANNMLTFSKDREPSIKWAHFNSILEDVISLSKYRAVEKKVTIETDLQTLPDLPLDAEGIHQVAHNILLNAIDAVPADTGRVIVRTRHDPATKKVVLSIADNGPGIPQSERERIFVVFHSSKGHRGTGLGLAAARKIVDELNGKIEIESTVGQGTTFHIHLHTDIAKVLDRDRTRTASH